MPRRAASRNAITAGIQDVPVSMYTIWFPPGERFGQVFHELFNHGKGTAKQVASRLKKRKVEFTEAQVQDAMDVWVARGWCAATEKANHLSQAALEFVR